MRYLLIINNACDELLLMEPKILLDEDDHAQSIVDFSNYGMPNITPADEEFIFLLEKINENPYAPEYYHEGIMHYIKINNEGKATELLSKAMEYCIPMLRIYITSHLGSVY
jgi:hypothetical protein